MSTPHGEQQNPKPDPRQDPKHAKEREEYFQNLIKTKYPQLQQSASFHNKDTTRAQTVLGDRDKHRSETQLQAIPQNSIDKDNTIREGNMLAEKEVKNQVGYIVQMAHKARRPIAQVPWVRIVGCETTTTYENTISWAEDLGRQLQLIPNQQLTSWRMQRMQPFMVCMDERNQYDAGTDRRIKRLLGLYENEFYDQRSKFQQHRNHGLTEEEHKTRSSFFAKEKAWREAKKRHDVKANADANADETTPTQKTVSLPPATAITLRNHQFPEHLKQRQFTCAVVSYFRDRLAFERLFRDLSLSNAEAEFQPILIIWGAFETRAKADEYMALTRCNHAFLQKSICVVDMYQWLPMDSENLQDIPITYANKHCNDIMSYKQSEAQAIEEYHAWEREKFGDEADFEETDPKRV